ncbi:tRNA (cytidine(56)-2'-O)-methyltransferase [Candidatus Bathyarchaeota archaeon]|nr:tRNA (cytidine(56)-2'-O)-methyltransferase [Candidatus Bathyarchaeota archaeon]
MPKILVLRWGHRPIRDARLTTHVALAARALGADGIIISDIEDPKIEETTMKISRNWGGKFSFKMGTKWPTVLKEWKTKGDIVVHLTAYGENIQTSNVLERIRKTGKNVMLIVGSQKVPREFYTEQVSDYNVAIGNQPHSECASLAVFLDRYFQGKELARNFEDAKVKIVPQRRGKKLAIQKTRKTAKQSCEET